MNGRGALLPLGLHYLFLLGLTIHFYFSSFTILTFCSGFIVLINCLNCTRQRFSFLTVEILIGWCQRTSWGLCDTMMHFETLQTDYFCVNDHKVELQLFFQEL